MITLEIPDNISDNYREILNSIKPTIEKLNSMDINSIPFVGTIGQKVLSYVYYQMVDRGPDLLDYLRIDGERITL